MRIDKLFEDDSPFVIESLQEVKAQLHDLRLSSGLGEEGATINAVEWNYFIKLQKIFSQKKIEPFKFHSLNAGLPNRVAVNHQIIQLKDRTCLWDGSRLYILSQLYTAKGASSLFRRTVMVPLSENEELQFYATVSPILRDEYDQSNLQPYFDRVSQEYTISLRAYNFLYPYLKPNKIQYELKAEEVPGGAQKILLSALMTRSYGEWNTLTSILQSSKRLTEVGFLSVMNLFLSILIIHEQSCLHRDLADKNVLVYGPGVSVQFIDLCSAVRFEKNLPVKEFDPLSTHPDFSSPYGFYDKQSDVFSAVFDLMRFEVFDQKMWDEKELADLVNHTHYKYKDEASFLIKLRRYQGFYKQLEESKPKPSWVIFLPYLLKLTHPDRSMRGNLIEIFRDINILKRIRDYIYTVGVISDLSSNFSTINGWSLHYAIGEIFRHHDQTCVASTAILMLTVFALHYKHIPHEIRINHKKHVECVLNGLVVSPQHHKILFHYEAEFPGYLSKNLCNIMINSVIIDVIEEAFEENSIIRSVLDNVCERVESQLKFDAIAHSESESVLRDVIDEIERRDLMDPILADIIDQTFNAIDLRHSNQRLRITQRNLLGLFALYAMLYQCHQSSDHLPDEMYRYLYFSMTLMLAFVISDLVVTKTFTAIFPRNHQTTVGLFRPIENSSYSIATEFLTLKA